MEHFLTTVKLGFVAIGVGFASLFGYTPTVDAPLAGSSFVTPEVRALFTTTLASKITSTATSMTLTSATDKDGNTLASSTYGFIIDEGTSVEEFVLADCTGTTCTNMTRGLSVSTGTTTVAALRFEHRRGASVKITDAPSLIFISNVFKGRQDIESPIRYSSSVATTTIDNDNRNLVNYEMLTYTAFNGAGVINASATQKGLVEVATGVQIASSTATDTTGAPLAITTSNSTSSASYTATTEGLKVVVTQNNGKIDNDFIATSTLFTNSGLPIGGTSNIASTSLLVYTATTTAHVGNYTWTKPNNLKYIIVEAVGGGGAGGGPGTNDSEVGAGGGGGGYCKNIVSASILGSTVAVVAGNGGATASGSGSGGTGASGGSSSFGSYCTAGGGSGVSNSSSEPGGAGGTASGGLLNVTGGGGSSAASAGSGGVGGNSFLGSGARGYAAGYTSDANGTVGGSYGGGGGGGAGDSSHAELLGGAGGSGVVIITEVYY